MYFFYRYLRFCHRCVTKFSVNALNPRATYNNSFSTKESPANALKDLFGCTYHQAYAIVRKYPELKNLNSARISRAGEQLKILNVDQQDLKKYPQVLGLLPAIMEQRALILKESGVSNITLQDILYHGTIIKKKISLLKSHGRIPESFSVSKNFLECVQASLDVYEQINQSLEGQEDDKTISFLRNLVLGYYLQHMLEASEEEVKHILKTYFRISYKSLLLINETLKILMEELKFPKSHVKSHGYLFHAHPRELRKMLENVPSLGGIPLGDFLFKNPIVAVSNYETFSQTLQLLKKAGISEKAIIETPLVFTLSVENVQKGLALLKTGSVKPEIKALLSHPQMLRLVVHHDSVNQRLNYLNNFEQSSEFKPVTSLNLLCGSPRLFERFMSGMGGTNRGNDVVNYVAKTLENVSKTDGERGIVTPTAVRESLKRHIHWRSVPLSEIQSCLEMLLKLGFTSKEIMFSLQIILYSPSKVKTQLKRLSQEDFLSTFDETLKKSEIEEEREGQPNVKDVQHEKFCIPSHVKQHALPLCLYFLEKDHHFSGDGIWFRQ